MGVIGNAGLSGLVRTVCGIGVARTVTAPMSITLSPPRSRRLSALSSPTSPDRVSRVRAREDNTTPIRLWPSIRAVISAFFITAIVWMGVADYPTELQLWQIICSTGTGYLWQYVILFGCWHAAIWWTVYWQRKLEGICPLCERRFIPKTRRLAVRSSSRPQPPCSSQQSSSDTSSPPRRTRLW